MIIILTFLYLLGFFSIMYVHYGKKPRKYYLLCKTSTSIIFVVIALLNMKDNFNFLWFLAFFLCLLGDIFLGIDEGGHKQTKNFILGVVSFAIAHFVFIPVMCNITPFKLSDLIFPIIMSFVTYFLTKQSFMDTKGNDIACIIYAFIVTSLMVKGIMVYLANPDYLLLMIGTILFFISDLILFFQYFCIKKINSLKFFNLLTYYSAVLLLAITNL